MHQNLWREFWILVGIGAVIVVLGAITDHPLLVAVVGLGLYIAVHLRHLQRLHDWLIHNKRSDDVPDATGLWGDAFNEIRKLLKQADQRTDRLTDMIERFQSAAAVMPDAVIILSQNDEIEWANSAAHHLVGVNFPRDASIRIGNLIRDPEFTRYLHGGEYAELLELPSPAKMDTVVSVQIVPYGASQKLIIFRDVTRIVRLEQTRRTFVANASHELRTPLTVLSGYLETLQGMQNGVSGELRKHFTTMYEQAERMQRLVNDLLMLSRLETAPPRVHEETVDIPAMLAGLAEQAQLLSGDQSHRIALDADATLRLLGGRDELTSGFSNIVNNAVRHTPPGGAITLRWYADDDGAKFAVVDTGEGIAAEHIPRLTERFYRVDTARSRASGGTGLGLSIVKHVLARHDAELRVESELGKGSTFTCVFPSARIVRAPAHAAVPIS